MQPPFIGFRPGFALFLCVLAASSIHGQSGPPKPAAVPMATYTDAAGDLSFDYPAVWKLDNSAAFSVPPHVVSGGLSSQARVVFSPAGNVYQRTNLNSLIFVYGKADKPSQEACTAAAVGSEPQKAETILVHGVSFQQFETTVGGMCHDADQQVYWTYRAGTCYVFEGDMNTLCAGVVDGQRALTAAETQALKRHLDAIPQSIRFAAAR